MRYFSRCLCLLLFASLFGSGSCASAGPEIIAFNAAGLDAPENTLYAARKALANGAGALWVTVRVSADGVPVLYRPDDLSVLTNHYGPVEEVTADNLKTADAGWRFGEKEGFPFRHKAMGIPHLEEMLKMFPRTTFYLEIRAPHAEFKRFAKTLQQVLARTDSLKRTRVYAADSALLDALPIAIRRFESQQLTRDTLIRAVVSRRCLLTRKSAYPRWHASPLRQRVSVADVTGAPAPPALVWLQWNKAALTCLQASGPAKLILSGIRNQHDLDLATTLHADGVLVSSLLWITPSSESKSTRVMPQQRHLHAWP
ncbi:glycerophosphodiester phosphodiesterase family protein [Trabulsiella odontotermitis]|uniref:glycerophosphodiester phosphodiesterase family protein n=1 Tax=Trabulsiella odontotermitis TaxID=379893 RepID=UPI000675CDD9|nr:glycerophosphodiester phosphodiesterase family protein [Trabulsiella odontotermitis]